MLTGNEKPQGSNDNLPKKRKPRGKPMDSSATEKTAQIMAALEDKAIDTLKARVTDFGTAVDAFRDKLTAMAETLAKYELESIAAEGISMSKHHTTYKAKENPAPFTAPRAETEEERLKREEDELFHSADAYRARLKVPRG